MLLHRKNIGRFKHGENMKIKNMLISVAAVFLINTGVGMNAIAGDFYLGAGAYQSSVDYDNFDDDDETVTGGFIGYTFVDSNIVMLSGELGYYDLGDTGNSSYKIDGDAVTAAGVVSLPIGPLFELYAKAGIASLSIDVRSPNKNFKDDGEEAFYGAGFSIDLFDTIDIYAEYLTFDTDVDSELLGVGAKLTF